MTSITQLPPQNEILRENLQRLVTVTARLEGTDLGTAVSKVQQRVQAMHLPPSIRIVYGGTYQEQQKSFADLLRVLIMALVLVFGVLLTEFRNFAAPTAILTSSVLSIAGVVGALLLTGTTFNVASFMGLIMVIGIVAKNGILLLDADERYRAEGASAREAMRDGSTTSPASHPDDRARRHYRNASARACAGRRIADAPAACDCCDRRAGDLMVLSLLVTPIVYYLLTPQSL